MCIGNAIRNAETPVMDRLAQAEGEYLTLDASGHAVGLPAGLMGNSEVGHFTIGTGRVIFQVGVAICMNGHDPHRAHSLTNPGCEFAPCHKVPLQYGHPEEVGRTS